MIIYSDDALLITSKVRGMSTLYHTENGSILTLNVGQSKYIYFFSIVNIFYSFEHIIVGSNC